jgi:ribulose-bisphosphate carboxylase small chain
MSQVQDYPSRLSDPKSRKAETFSYLPKMTEDQIRAQIQYIIDQGWNPAIEHTEPENAMMYYWYMWKLPMFGETSVDAVMKEIWECIEANPRNHVRLLGYDNIKQSQGANMLVKRGDI